MATDTFFARKNAMWPGIAFNIAVYLMVGVPWLLTSVIGSML